MSAANYRKSVAAGLVAVAGVAGGAVTVGLVSGRTAVWILFAIVCAKAVASVVAVWATPNGPTIYDRVSDVERQLQPAVSTIADAALEAPFPESWKQTITKVDKFIDEHAGVAATAPWPTTGVDHAEG